MAIFKKDLENINAFNDKNRKIHTRSELLQFINLQNETSDYDFVDFKFELNVNFKKRFDQHKKIFRDIANKKLDQNGGLGDFVNIFNNGLFNRFLDLNSNIFSNLERLVYEVKQENSLFVEELVPVSNSAKNSKKNRFDFLHSFLLNVFPNNIEDNVILGENSSFSTISKNLEYIDVKSIRGNDVEYSTKLKILYNKIISNPVQFLQVYGGLNFLKTDEFKLIKNHTKPLSLMTLTTAINNIVENSFDYMSCNSLFKGIYTEDELNSKLKIVDFTSVPFIESDVTKEILPIKYIDRFEVINNNELKELIKDFNLGLLNNQNIKKSNDETISEDIFKFENFLCSEETISSANFSIKPKLNDIINQEINNQFLLPTQKLLEITTAKNKNDLISIGHKTDLDYLECLSMIGNQVNSNQIKLMYGVVEKKNSQPDYSNIKYRPVIDQNKKGILNYKFEDIEDFTASIIKTRLICNNIVKKFKKYSINKGLDAASVNNANTTNLFLEPDRINLPTQRKNIEYDNTALTLKDSIIQINSNIGSNLDFIESFNNQDNVFEIFNKKNNKINPRLIIIDNKILGEMQADDFVSSHPELGGINGTPINLNRQIDNEFNLNFDEIKSARSIKKEEIKGFIDEYYKETHPAFINTTTFFQKIKDICSENLKWHLKKKQKTNVSSDRADILNNASILWLFNDACKEMTKEKKEEFQNNFVKLLISYLYISSRQGSNSNLKASYNTYIETVILNQGPTPSTITELAPFFSFFTSERQTATNSLIRSKNLAVRSQDDPSKKYNEYYNITPNTFETNGKSTHFLSVPAQLLDKKRNISYNSGHKLVDDSSLGFIPDSNTPNQKKKNILLAGFNTYFQYNEAQNQSLINKEYIFVPQLTFKKVLNEDNQYRFEYFLYNAAMAEAIDFFINFNNELSYFPSYDLIQNLIDKFGNIASEKIDKISYNFQTQNSFLNVLNFGNPYNVEIENNALNNNIFYQIISLFKDLIPSNLSLTNNNFQTAFENLNDKKIIDLQFMIKNTLKIASSIYCKMFNNLQSYTNLADRISESNYFYENSFDNQKLLTNIANGVTNNTDLKKYSKDMWQYYSNIFLNESQLHTNFTLEDFQKYRSFASKKFIYFLNEVLGIEKNEIEILMEKILSYNVNHENNVFQSPTTNLITRHKRLNDFINSNSTTNLFKQSYVDTLNYMTSSEFNTELNTVEFMSNPFELFNLYDSYLFQLIPGLYNSNATAINKDYQIELTPNLTIMNLFKAGNDCKFLYLEIQRQMALSRGRRNPLIYTEKEISFNEFINLSNILKRIDLLSFYKNFNSIFEFDRHDDSLILNNLITPNVARQITSNLIKPASSFIDDDGISTIGIRISNFFDDINTYINIVDIDDIDNAGGSLIDDKQNYAIFSKLNSLNIFDSIINNSFNLSTNYDTLLIKKEVRNQTTNQFFNNISIPTRVSGLKESYNYSQGFMNINQVINIPQLSLNLISSNDQSIQSMLNQKYVDINKNWYNHILHGLITNDLGLAFSHDILLYYYGNFVEDFKRSFDKLKQKRDSKITINNHSLNVTDAKANLNFENIDNNLFDLSIDNVKLQKNYMKSLIKTKSLKNIVNLAPQNALENVFENDINQFMEKIVTLNNKNENGDFFMSYFDDFYIKDLWHSLNTTQGETAFRNKINKNYQRTQDNNNQWNIPNQAETVVGSHILTVGVNNDYKLDKDDIILIKVEMTDHDFPEIVWEPKIFEYCSAFEDIENVFLQHKSTLKFSSIDNITNENPPIGINSYYLDANVSETSVSTLKDSLIRLGRDNIVDGLNLNNNIGSINYSASGDKSLLNPILYQNVLDEVLRILNISNDDFIYSKLPYDFVSKLTSAELQKVREEIIKRCIHNQKMNLRLKKISKLLNGFEPNPEFSITGSNKWMQDMFVLDDIYNIFIEKFQGTSDLDNIKEIYPFTYEEISNAIKENQYNYSGLNFHKVHFTTNHKLNIYLQFMSDFTKAVLPDFINLSPHNFQKVYTLAVNPKDFIVTGFTGGNNSFIPTSSELEFRQIVYTENGGRNIRNKILDEIGTETSLILRLISDKTTERDDINYYRVFNKKAANGTRYIPKNVSYRISTIIME